MAGDWIPMRLDLAEDPAVMHMAELIGCSENEIVGRLHKVWSWASRQCHDGCVTNVTLVSLGRVTNLTGFPEAMRDAGWLEEAIGADGKPSLVFPKWEMWLGQSAKKRLIDAKRQAKHRQSGSHADVTKVSRNDRDKIVTTGEERRGQENKNTPIVPKGTGEGFGAFWNAVHRREGRGVAEKAFGRAVAAVASSTGKSKPEAANWITDRMKAFAASAQAADEIKGKLHPATWLNQGRYDDDPAIWNNGEAPSVSRVATAADLATWSMQGGSQ
jgi:hypothetical protein